MSKLSNTNNPKFSLEGRSLNSFCMSKVGQKEIERYLLVAIEKVSTSYHSEQRS